jgi:hypothetical protein
MGAQRLQQLFPPSGIDAWREARESNAEHSGEINADATAAQWRRCDGWRHGATATRSLGVGEADSLVVREWTTAEQRLCRLRWAGRRS